MAVTKGVVFVLMAIAATASTAAAGSVKVGGTYGPYQAANGGEFTLINLSGFSNSAYDAKAKGFTNNSSSFQTFCVENSTPPEYIYLNTTYNATLNTKAINGGLAQSFGGDPLSQGTGWLYSQFARGVLTGYNYGPGYGGTEAQREATALLLQRTFWWLEGEGGIAFTDTNIFMKAVALYFGGGDINVGKVNAKLDGTGGNYGVRVINMTKSDGTLTQDQLFYVPDFGSTVTLFGCALVGLGALRRKFNA